jgi:nucleoid-associated protein EbfC
MKGMPGGMHQLMKQVNQTQNRIKKLREDLALREFEATSGGGAVTIKVNDENTLLSVKISKEVVESGDNEMLEDLILTATNEALRQAKETTSTEMEKATRGLSFPGLF